MKKTRKYRVHRSYHFADGQQLATARQWAGLTQQELADLADIHRATVQYWEADTVIAAGHAERRIVDVLAAYGIESKSTPQSLTRVPFSKKHR